MNNTSLGLCRLSYRPNLSTVLLHAYHRTFYQSEEAFSYWKYILTVYYKVSKTLHRDAGPCWLQCFPQLYQVGSMCFGWWTILDTHVGKLLSVEKPSIIAVLDTLRPVRMEPTSIPCSKALQSFVLPIHPLYGTHTQSTTPYTVYKTVVLELLVRLLVITALSELEAQAFRYTRINIC